MKIHPAPQGSSEWLYARCEIPTASEFKFLLTPKFKIKEGDGPSTYLAEKVAQKWQHCPLPTFKSAAMEVGEILENEAKPWFELETGRKITNVGLCLHDSGLVGCSPDGLFDDGTGIEIKCPQSDTHVGYILDGVLPEEYAAQVHGSMWVTGAKEWTFLSYRRNFPAFILKVKRDETIQTQISKALEAFLDRVEAAMQRLEQLHGGTRPPKPVRPWELPPEQPQPTMEAIH